MFSFLKRGKPLGSYGFLEVDMHSHLLPGIDDGAKDMEDSLSLIRALVGMGYKKLITTPHVMADLYPNTPEVIRERLSAVRAAVQDAGIAVELDAAAEYMMDEGFEAILESGELLALPGKRVLVEMGFIAAPPKLDQYLFRLQTKGYRPVLAHPERYLFFREDFGRYRELKERGCALQLNLLSLTGYYGKPVRENAVALLKAGLIDFLGTDLHHERHVERLRVGLEDREIGRLLEGLELRNLDLW
jgi:tyrosine-protein phosphatase YwqE